MISLPQRLAEGPLVIPAKAGIQRRDRRRSDWIPACAGLTTAAVERRSGRSGGSVSDEFLTLAGAGEAETRVRGSRFLAIAFPASSEAGVRSILEERERARFDATHHCAAWRFRDGSWRALDAGEPSGSAGAPILSAIDAAGLTDAAVIVTRYFGGTKLGIGGLVRAYGDSTSQALAAAPKRRGVAAVRLRIRYPYDLTTVVMRALERRGTCHVEHGYVDAGNEAVVDLTLPANELRPFAEFLREQSAGLLEPEVGLETVVYAQVQG
ncbi:MAG: hypothetical protein GEU90_11780 [Gemmatimonas sp.]|nr:hypothetical protein [Gemmatimonas sp.]